MLALSLYRIVNNLEIVIDFRKGVTYMEERTYFDGETIHFNPSDLGGMFQLMKRSDDFDQPLFGQNQEGESVSISVNSSNITTLTFQSNGWTRENIYYDDGRVEELFHR